MTEAEITKVLALVDKFKILENGNESILHVAARYPLIFPETTSVLLGTNNAEQAYINFKEVSDNILSNVDIEKIADLQKKLHLFRGNKITGIYHSLISRCLVNRLAKIG